jgi:hypothetical protein
MSVSCTGGALTGGEVDSATVVVDNDTGFDIEVVLCMGDKCIAYSEIPEAESVSFAFDGEDGLYQKSSVSRILYNVIFFNRILLRAGHRYYREWELYSNSFYPYEKDLIIDFCSTSSQIFDMGYFKESIISNPSSDNNNNVVTFNMTIGHQMYYDAIMHPLVDAIGKVNGNNKDIESWGFKLVDGIYYFDIERFEAIIDENEAIAQYVADRNEVFETARQEAMAYMNSKTD